MNWSNGCRIRLVLLGFVAAVVLAAGGSAKADFVFGTPENLGPAVNSSGGEFGPYLSADGLEFYFDRGGTESGIYVARRATLDSEWEPASEIVNLAWYHNPFLTPDGLTLFLTREQDWPGTFESWDLWVTTRATKDDNCSTPVNLGTTVNSSSDDGSPSLSADGLELYFSSTRPGGYGNYDLWMTARATVNDNWGTPVNLGPPVNTSADEAFQSISSDGLVFFFCSTRSGGSGEWDLYMARRTTSKDPWGSPTNLGPAVNSAAADHGVRVSADGSMLYFSSLRAGGLGNWDIWQVPILRVVDFNGDGKVDGKEVLAMAQHWGQSKSLYDIGLSPMGDGAVDANDLTVLAGYIGQDVNDPTLIAHWALDEAAGMTAADSVGGKDAIAMGNPSWQPAGGKVGGALACDGVDDFVLTQFELNPAKGPFSVLAWVKGGAPGEVVVCHQGGADWLYTNPIDGSLMTGLMGTGRIAGLGFSDVVITDGQWHRIGLVWDGTNRILLVDGKETARDEQSKLANRSGRLVMGTGKSVSPASFWSGLIDDVRIYDRAVKP